MANLSGNTSSGEPSWDKYVKNKPDFMSTEYFVENNIRNEPLYDLKFNNQIDQVNTGEKIYIKSRDYVTNQRSKYAKVSYKNKIGYLRLSAIRKPTKTINQELRTLEATSNTLDALKVLAGIGRSPRYGVDIEVPGLGLYPGITKIEKVTNKIHGRQVKSDFVFKNSLGRRVLYVSHKTGNGAEGFSQYGGVSEVAGSFENPKLIYQDPEVQSFLLKLYSLYQDSLNDSKIENNPFLNGVLKKGIYSEIQSSRLINLSVYGPEYGNQITGPSNADMIGQGSFIFTPLLNESGDMYFRLSFSGHSSINGQTEEYLNDNSPYRAILLSTPRAGRVTNTPSGKLSNIRTGIYPRKYRENSILIDTLNIQ